MLFQSLNKFKRSSIITSMILMALGLVMTMCPERYIDSLITAMGYLALILAVVMVLEYLNSRKALVNTILLGCAMVIGLLGVAVLVFRGSILQILGWMFGVLLVLQGIELLYSAIMYFRPSGRHGWWLLAILAVLLIGAGVTIFLNPWWNTPKELLGIIGVTLLFDAAVSIVRL
ncbi:MAG: DUF308 domain-containing protein, partial [Clostridia bacterium]|nr:DUF308 domain-containing protein [Clostridia bacterium]